MNEKKILNKVKTLLGLEVKLEQMMLEDGVTVIEAEFFEPEYPVNIVAEDGQLIPLPVGEYTLEDGRTLVVEVEGIIKEVMEAQAPEQTPNEPAPAEAPVAASEGNPVVESPQAKVIIESIVKEMKFTKEEIENEITALKAELETLKQQKVELELAAQSEPAAEPIKHNPESNVELSVNPKSMTKRGRLTEFLNNVK